MKGGARKGAGRKPRPDDKMIRVAISLAPEQYAWLKAQPASMSLIVRVLILREMSEEAIRELAS